MKADDGAEQRLGRIHIRFLNSRGGFAIGRSRGEVQWGGGKKMPVSHVYTLGSFHASCELTETWFCT